MKQYLDVTVEIEPAPGGAAASAPYRVRITSWDGRKGESGLVLPFTLADLAGVVVGAAQVARDSKPDDDPAPGTTTPKEFGEKLFLSLFTGEVKSILDKAIGVADDRQNTGLRLRLSMNLGDAGMSDVASLPWELLRDPSDAASALVLSTRRLLVRSLDVPLPSQPHPFEKPLRILVVIANPKGTMPLNLEEERARIQQAWGGMQGTELHFAKPVEREVRQVLATADFHVVHFMGHGEFSAASGGAILLEDDNGDKAPVTGEQFAEWLQDELPALRLVFLNACRTGTTTLRSGVDPFGGVATALIRGGIPAVVAMQFPISDRGAIAFSDTFYQRVVAGDPVDAAVAEARKQLGPEFATPVLYMRSADGALFTPATPAIPVVVPQAVAAVPAASVAPLVPGPSAPGAAPDPWGPGAADAFRVFLGAPNEKLRPQHRTLARQLREAGVKVMDAVPPPYEVAEHATVAEAVARAADLCVHILGETSGESYDDVDPLRTFTLEQLRIALKVAKSLLVLIPDEVEISAIADAPYRTFIASMVERPRDAASFELVRTGKHQLADEVTAKLQKLRDARQAAATPAALGSALGSAFVDAHKVDRDCARLLEDALIAQNIDVTMKTTSASPTDAIAQFDVNLASFPLYIVVSGGADPAWVKNRSTAARKTAALQDAQAIVAEFSVASGGERKLVIRYDSTEESATKAALLASFTRGPA